MKKNFDIIEYPLKIKNKNDIMYSKLAYKYEFRILESFDSKRIYATKKRTNSVYLYIQINDESNFNKDKNCSILGYTTNLYTFDGPSDFYIDFSESSLFYNKIGSILLNGTPREILDLSQEFNMFPPYLPPILNYHEKASKVLKIKEKFKINKKERKTIKVCVDEPIPDNKIPEQNDKDYLLSIVYKFISNIPHPILKIKQIYNLFVDFKKTHNININFENVKNILPLFRYYVKDGPFRKSWVPFGYDPKLNSENYKYQIIDLRSEGTFYHLFENNKIIEEVEKNRIWYVKNDFDTKNGFHKPTLIQLILYYNYLEVDCDKKEDDDNDDDIFEIVNED